MRHLFLVLPLLAGCAVFDQTEPPRVTGTIEAGAAPPPPRNARTVEQFDTTTRAERAAAASPVAGGRQIGTVVASLGDPGRPGFWLETPLVSEERTGRLQNVANGRTVEVTLLPVSDGSSRASLAALRVLEAPLGDLSELVVFLN